MLPYEAIYNSRKLKEFFYFDDSYKEKIVNSLKQEDWFKMTVLIYFKESGEINKVIDENTGQEIAWDGVLDNGDD